MRVGILGLNHKLADLKLREALAEACQRRFSAHSSAHGDIHHFVLLSTCNRTEIYFSSENLAETHTYILKVLRNEVDVDFDQKLYSYFGRDCFHHLCRVAIGLDSAIVGETEIMGQVKCAYDQTLRYASLTESLHFLFQKALKIGKQVRSALPMQRGLPDLEHAILNAGVQTFANLDHINVLFVGASEINCKVLSFFKAKGLSKITLCNRSSDIAEAMANSYGLQILSWNNLNNWHHYDWVICGTKAPKYLIDTPPHTTLNQKLLIDLSVPRNINPGIKNHHHLKVLNIDEINASLSMRHQQLAEVLHEAECMAESLTSQQTLIKQQKDHRRAHYRQIQLYEQQSFVLSSG